MRISAKVDYAIRAAAELATADGQPMTAETISTRQEIPVQFLQKILFELRRARIVVTLRGREGGHRLARPADEITVADIIRAVEGPLADVRGEPPETIKYAGAAEQLLDVWIALRTNIRAVLEHVTLADIAGGTLPEGIAALAADPESWTTR